MGIELDSETRILIGRLVAPANPERPWWWQSSTTVDGVESIVAGFAATEHEAILEAAASTIDLDRHAARSAPKAVAADPRSHPPGWWPGPTDQG